MSRATVQGFGVLQGLFGSKQSAPLRGGFGLSVHFAWDNGTSISGGYMHGRGDGIAPSAIYIGGPDYHIGRETVEQSYSRPPIPNREMVPSPWPWIWEKLKQEWNEAELANEAHRRGEDWLTDECFLYEEGKYDKPLRHLGKRDASGKFCDVGGQLVPMDEPLREVGPDLIPEWSPLPHQELPTPSPVPTQNAKPTEPNPASPSAQFGRPGKRKPQQTETSGLQVAETPVQAESTPNEVPKEIPKRLPNKPSESLGESARLFASGFGKGVRDEGERMYRDAKELPDRIARTGRELVEDVREGRKLRALAPIEAMGHAIQNASLDDVERLAHGVVDSARDWYHKPAKEKGESLGRATMSMASDAAMAALTDGLGTVAGLRKAEKAAEVANHARDAERAAASVTHKSSLERTGRGRNHLQPDANADGSHTTFRRNQDGNVSHHVEWTPNSRNPSGFDEVKRVDTQYANPHTHRNKVTDKEIMTPHAHDPAAPGGIREARPDERPR